MFAAATLVAVALASSALAQPSPLTPGTSNSGSDCVIQWSPDTTGTWKQTNIQLMTGDNLNMVPLTTVATVDTTSGAATTFTWKCPEVTLNAPVYFYQFSHSAEPNNLQWTTRWAIADDQGNTVPAPETVQPDGSNVAWGTGALADPSIAKPAPPYIVGQTQAGGGTGTGAGAATGSSSAPASASTPASTPRASSMTRTPVSSSKGSVTTTATTESASGSSAANANRAPLAFGVVAAVAGLFALA